MTVARVTPNESTTTPWAGPSPNIWGKLSPANLLEDPHAGHHFWEDWQGVPLPATNTTGNMGRWKHFLSDGALFTDGAIANLSSIGMASDGDNEAAILCYGSTAQARITKGNGRPVRLEGRFKFSTIADTKNGFFFGFFEPLTPTGTSHAADDGTLADENFIGFHRLEGDGDKIDIVYKADGQTQQSFADALTLVADTWYRLGLYFDGEQTVRFYFNNVEYETARLGASHLDAATFPDDINLQPVIVGAKNATGSTPGTNYCNWVRGAWLANADDGFA